MPAEAGIQVRPGSSLDSRLRGNDNGQVPLVATRVIPAQAGIQVRPGSSLDSRLRGNDNGQVRMGI